MEKTSVAAEGMMEKLLRLASPEYDENALKEAVGEFFKEQRKTAEYSFAQEVGQRRAVAALANLIAEEAYGTSCKAVDPWSRAQETCQHAAAKLKYDRAVWHVMANLIKGRGDDAWEFASAGFGMSQDNYESISTPEIIALAVAISSRKLYKHLTAVHRQTEATRERVNGELPPF